MLGQRRRRPCADLTNNVLCCSGVHQQGDNQAVQTQDFCKNQDQDHTDKQSWLLGGTSDTGVTDNADGEAGSQPCQADGQACTQLDETCVQRLLLLQRRRDQHRHNQPVNGNDTGHNDWNGVLNEQVWSEDTGCTDTDTRLGGTVRGTETGEDDGGSTTN